MTHFTLPALISSCAIRHGLREWVSMTGGPGGIFNIPRPSLGRYYWIAMGSAAIALWLAANLRRSAWGRAFLAVKGSEVAAESLGLSAYYLRIVAFTQGSGGEIYVLDYDLTGQIYELVPSGLKDTTVTFPRRLSETG